MLNRIACTIVLSTLFLGGCAAKSVNPEAYSGFASGQCLAHEEEIKELINAFEKAQMERDPKAVLALFTPEESSEDASMRAFLSGSDAGGYHRLYSTGPTNFIQPAFVIVGIPETIDSQCITKVVEWRRYYPHGIGGDFGDGRLYTVYFWTIREAGNSWKIGGYFSDKSLQKFSGWD